MNILIIEDEAIIALDIKNILEADNHIVCGIADNRENALEMFHNHHPEIIISDIFIKGDKSGIEIAHEILAIRKVQYIFITAFSSIEVIKLVSDFQNITYITKPFSNTQILAAVAMMAEKVKKQVENNKLSTREKEVVEMLIHGKSTTEISEKLHISPETLKTHKKNIFLKYNVNSTSKLISLILNSGNY